MSSSGEVSNQIDKAISHQRLFDNHLSNPTKFDHYRDKIFAERKDVNDMLEQCYVKHVPYHEIWPQNCTAAVKERAKTEQRCISTTLHIRLSMHKSLRDVTEPTKVNLAMDFHGGGGFTGSPNFVPWMHKPRLEYQFQKRTIILVDPEYPLLPQSDGRAILENQEHIVSWLFEQAETIIREENRNLEVDWTHTLLSGSSFGGGLALDMALNAICSSKALPKNLGIKLHVRYGLIHPYVKEGGEYMGVKVSREEAEDYSLKMRSLRDADVLLIPQAARDPPDGMFGAYSSSVSGQEDTSWSEYWRAQSFCFRLVRRNSAPPYRLAIRLDHGTSDSSVSYKDSQSLRDILLAKFWQVQVELHLQPNHEHGYDYDNSLGTMEAWYSARLE